MHHPSLGIVRWEADAPEGAGDGVQVADEAVGNFDPASDRPINDEGFHNPPLLMGEGIEDEVSQEVHVLPPQLPYGRCDPADA